MITISAKDIKRAIVVEPAWYRIKIDSYLEKTAASGKSQNHWMEGTILFNGDNGDTKFSGVPTPTSWLFNDGAISFAVDFLKACGAEVGEEGGRFDLNDAVGKEIDVFIENDVYEGRTVNKLNHKYRKAKDNLVAKVA